MENQITEANDVQAKITTITLFFDKLDLIDEKLYGKRLRFFIISSFFVVLIAPFLDYLFDKKKDVITAVCTALYLILIITFFLTWISAWRDDDGNWTMRRAWYRIKTYFENIFSFYGENKDKKSSDLLYGISIFLIVGSICVKALQNASVLYRHTVNIFGDFYMKRLRGFESFVNHSFFYFLCAGLLLLSYLLYKDKEISSKLLLELKSIFRKSDEVEVFEEIVTTAYNGQKLIISSKDQLALAELKSKIKSEQFSTFIKAMGNWHPHTYNNEYEYQEKLKKHLHKSFPKSAVATEFPIKDELRNIRRRADIVVHNHILIELKKDSKTTAMDRAKSQLDHYTEIWKGKGPVVLVTCKLEMDHVQKHFSTRFEEMVKAKKNIMAIVVN